jgi:hypothetical protein
MTYVHLRNNGIIVLLSTQTQQTQVQFGSSFRSALNTGIISSDIEYSGGGYQYQGN